MKSQSSVLKTLGRFWNMVCDLNFWGLLHLFSRLVGLRGKVSVPVMLEPDQLVEFTGRSSARSALKPRSGIPKILYFSHNLNREGAAISLFELVRALRDRSKVVPELISFEDGALRLQYEEAGIPVSVIPSDADQLSTLSRLERAEEKWSDIINRKNPDAVFANTLKSFLPVLAAKKSGIPSIWNVREGAAWDQFFAYLPNRVAQRAISAVRFPDRVVFVSHASRRIWEQFDRYGNFTVIHNGIDLFRFSNNVEAQRKKIRSDLNLSDDATVILCVGTLSPRKAQGDLIESMGFLPGPILDRTHLFLVGDDQNPYGKKLKHRRQLLPRRVAEKIHFFGSSKSVEAFYRSADIFVFCSREESYPRVILEAMAFELPIITTPVHGISEQVIEGTNAFFYAAGNMKALADRIESLVVDETLRKKLGRSSWERFSRLNAFEQMIDAYEAICREAFSGTPNFV